MCVIFFLLYKNLIHVTWLKVMKAYSITANAIQITYRVCHAKTQLALGVSWDLRDRWQAPILQCFNNRATAALSTAKHISKSMENCLLHWPLKSINLQSSECIEQIHDTQYCVMDQGNYREFSLLFTFISFDFYTLFYMKKRKKKTTQNFWIEFIFQWKVVNSR